MSQSTVLLRLAAALTLVALNGFFVAVEFAVVAVRRTRLERLVGSGNVAARAALALTDNPDRVIAASQLGITIASLALGWIGEATVAAIIEPPLEALLGGWSKAAAHTIGLVLAFSLVTLVHIVLGEQVPKTIAIRYADATALTISQPMTWFIRVFRPLIFILDRATALVLRLLRMEPIGGHQSVFTLEELKLIVRESQVGGAIEAQQEEMLQKVFQFRDRQVNEAMIPRPEVVGIEADATVQDLIQLFAGASHARFPVYQDDLDNIVGVLSIKDVLRALAETPDQLQVPIRDLARPALFIPEMAAVGDLFTRMRAMRTQMAVVIDEYGGTAGIVTLEELVEEIVGQLSDELVPAEDGVVHLDAETVVINAQLRIDEVNERLGIALPEEEQYETVAGMVLYRLQRVPQEGDLLPCQGMDVVVKEMRGPKIEKVEIRRTS